LADHHQHAEAPGDEDRQQVAWFGEVQRADLPRAGRDQFTVLGEVTGEEQGQRQLGELAGLEVDRPEADPDARAAHRGAQARDHRQHEQARAEEEERPLVARQVAGALDEEQHGDEQADGDERPRGLQAGATVRQSHDHHVTEAMEDRGDRQHRRIGAAGEHAHGDVGHEQQPEQDPEERDDARRDLGVAAERGQHVGRAGDDPGHHDEAELGRSPLGGVPGRRHGCTFAQSRAEHRSAAGPTALPSTPVQAAGQGSQRSASAPAEVITGRMGSAGPR
jgi:hypothetical protein